MATPKRNVNQDQIRVLEAREQGIKLKEQALEQEKTLLSLKRETFKLKEQQFELRQAKLELQRSQDHLSYLTADFNLTQREAKLKTGDSSFVRDICFFGLGLVINTQTQTEKSGFFSFF